jgi:hypothetical protein
MLVQPNGILAINKYIKEIIKMTIQTINLGNYANDGTGDDLRTAFIKVNSNFNDLYASISNLNGQNIGSGQGIFSADTAGIMSFKSLTGSTGITVTNNGDTINIAGTIYPTSLVTDTNPALGGNLNLNGHNVTGGDIQTTVYGLDIRSLQNQLTTLLSSGVGDQGTFASPAISEFDLGTF